ncbi:hypothetical protein BDW02DRAFT_646170 [Decorospora gaudefroyi]|uniref:Uncharacterized protein n=1 Tax=Decorospora gaudefroyi TaxID=184978 RepID=A0A6A5KKF9_9PLEO|nr:hypothetical protein BDW02DRAFT_646170 [Decorospora gaudefroyi]
MAPPKHKTPTPPPPTSARDPDTSPELGSPSKMTQYNKQTGRPVRKSAGKIKKVEGYVDFEDDEFGPLTSDLSEEEDDEELEPRRFADKKKLQRGLKRKRSPSPPSPRLEPVIYQQELGELTDDEEGGAFHRHNPKKPAVTLQFNVPLGFHGPLFVKLDSTLLQTNEQDTLREMQPDKSKKAPAASPQPKHAPVVRRKGFTDLPPELRNTIYRYIFARKDTGDDLTIPMYKGTSRTLARSAQFLRTCKVIHHEGCSVLYGDNIFSFERHHSTRGAFWEPVPKEIGYQDVLHFLKMIGPENLQYLREVRFFFDDALPQHTSYVDSHEKRRYLNDDYLIHCLRILREAKLRKIHLKFDGRRQLHQSDVKFLGYLEQIKADEVVQISHDRPPWYREPKKIHKWVWDGIKEAMTRKKKLYNTE